MSTATAENPTTDTLAAQVASINAAAVAQARREYPALLRRNASPAKGDAERLVEVMRLLELTPTDLQSHLSILARHAAHARVAGTLADLEAKEQAIEAERRAFEERTAPIEEKIRQERQRMDDTARPLTAGIHDARMNAAHAAKLENEYAELFGDVPAVPLVPNPDARLKVRAEQNVYSAPGANTDRRDWPDRLAEAMVHLRTEQLRTLKLTPAEIVARVAHETQAGCFHPPYAGLRGNPD